MEDLNALVRNVLNNFRIYKTESDAKVYRSVVYADGQDQIHISSEQKAILPKEKGEPLDNEKLSDTDSKDAHSEFEEDPYPFLSTPDKFVIDFVLVYKKSVLKKKKYAGYISMFLANLEEIGIVLKVVPHQVQNPTSSNKLFNPKLFFFLD